MKRDNTLTFSFLSKFEILLDDRVKMRMYRKCWWCCYHGWVWKLSSALNERGRKEKSIVWLARCEWKRKKGKSKVWLISSEWKRKKGKSNVWLVRCEWKRKKRPQPKSCQGCDMQKNNIAKFFLLYWTTRGKKWTKHRPKPPRSHNKLFCLTATWEFLTWSLKQHTATSSRSVKLTLTTVELFGEFHFLKKSWWRLSSHTSWAMSLCWRQRARWTCAVTKTSRKEQIKKSYIIASKNEARTTTRAQAHPHTETLLLLERQTFLYANKLHVLPIREICTLLIFI